MLGLGSEVDRPLISARTFCSSVEGEFTLYSMDDETPGRFSISDPEGNIDDIESLELDFRNPTVARISWSTRFLSSFTERASARDFSLIFDA